jgi:hypothetical protein
MNSKRLWTGIGMGAILGIFCIIGVSQRMPPNIENVPMYLAAAWYNRVIMGIIIGLSGELSIGKLKGLPNQILRGAIIGLVVSFAFGLFSQTPEYLYIGAGVVFGIINDVVTSKIAI